VLIGCVPANHRLPAAALCDVESVEAHRRVRDPACRAVHVPPPPRYCATSTDACAETVSAEQWASTDSLVLAVQHRERTLPVQIHHRDHVLVLLLEGLLLPWSSPWLLRQAGCELSVTLRPPTSFEVRVKKKRFTGEQIAYALAQESTGQTIAKICRKLGDLTPSILRHLHSWTQGLAHAKNLRAPSRDT
jgi:hypothetical protein